MTLLGSVYDMRPDGAYIDACALRAALANNDISARAALETCFAAIDARNAAINAVIYQNRKSARAAADACDQASQSLGPLHGVPVTIKECFDWAGHPTTWGDPDRAGHIAKFDSAVVTRLKSAGAVIIGKTNIPPYLSDWETDNPLFGPTSNPRDFTRSAGGSSGGSAAAVACGFSYIDIGSDQGGSIRLPAHYCGVHGLKPTWGTISLRGHSPLGDVRTPDIGVAGPIARSARDVALALKVLADTPINSANAPSNLRIAVLPSHADCPIDSNYAAALAQFCSKLRSQGHDVQTAAPDIDLSRATEVMNLLVRAETAPKSQLVKTFRANQGAALQKQNSFAQMNSKGADLSHRDWLALHEERLGYCDKMAEFFIEYDLLLCPAAASEAAPLRIGVDVTQRTIPVNGQEEPVLHQHLLYMFGSLCYLPAHVAPTGLTASGFPVGVQMIGPIGQDLSILAMAENIEAVTFNEERSHS